MSGVDLKGCWAVGVSVFDVLDSPGKDGKKHPVVVWVSTSSPDLALSRPPVAAARVAQPRSCEHREVHDGWRAPS